MSGLSIMVCRCEGCESYHRELTNLCHLYTVGTVQFEKLFAFITKTYPCENRPTPTHKGNGVHTGLWAGTLTMSPNDGLNEEDMVFAIKKIFAQQTVPVKNWAWYREYTANGLPHIHFCYETDTGGRIFKKIFQRYWKVWDEPRNQKGKAGFRGGYHSPAKSPTAYVEYMSKDSGRSGYKGFSLQNDILQKDN